MGSKKETLDLEEKAEKLQAYAKELEEFISLVCRELDEPLRKIKGYGLLIQEKKHLLTAELNDYLSHMIDGTEHMSHLIHSLLELASASKKELYFEKVNLNHTLENVLLDLQIPIHERHAKITIASELPDVKADRVQMFQLFNHVLSNALRFSKNDPVILIQGEEFESFARIMIQNNRLGVPSKYTERIFDPFFKLEGEKGDIGVGLAICKKILQRHKGRISAESSEHLGTIIVIDLPSYYASEEELLS